MMITMRDFLLRIRISRSNFDERMRKTMRENDFETDIGTLCVRAYSFEKFVDTNDVYNISYGVERLETDCVLASLTAGCLKIEEVIYRSSMDMLPVYEVYAKASAGSEDWICVDSPDDVVPEVDPDDGVPRLGLDLFRNMYEALERVRVKHGLSYTDPDFESVAGKKVSAEGKPQENGGIGMA